MKKHGRQKNNRGLKQNFFPVQLKHRNSSAFGYIPPIRDNGQFEGKPHNTLGITKTRLPQFD